jgi:hypothetical protein
MSQTIKIKLTEGDYLIANRLHYRRSPMQVLGWIFIGVAGYLFFSADREFDEISFAGLWLMSFSAVIVVLQPVLAVLTLPWRATKIFRQSKPLQEEMEISWDDDTLVSKGETWSATSRWTDFVKHRENDEIILLYPNDVSFRMFPKRFFDGKSLTGFTNAVRTKVRRA